MSKMILIVIVFALLLAGGLWVRRSPRRASPGEKPAPSAPMDHFQTGVMLDTRVGREPEAKAKPRLMERLQREESRQRPAEGRN